METHLIPDQSSRLIKKLSRPCVCASLFHFCQFPDLSQPKLQSTDSSNIVDNFRRVKTFSGNYHSGSIDNLVQEAEYTSAALQTISCPLDNEVATLLTLKDSHSKDLFLSQGVKFEITADHPVSVPSESRFLHFPTFQTPPKLEFGHSATKLCPSDSPYVPSLSNSLLIEYLARVSCKLYLHQFLVILLITIWRTLSTRSFLFPRLP